MTRPRGGYIGFHRAPAASAKSSAASGVWTLREAESLKRAGTWPLSGGWDVRLLMHMNGDNDSTTFTDSGPDGVSITRYGDTKISTTQSKFGGSSAYFDGSGDYLKTGDMFDFSTDYWTIECWMYCNVSQNAHFISNVGDPYAGINIYVESGYIKYNNGISGTISGSVSGKSDQWIHIALVRSAGEYGAKVTLYVDGADCGYVTDIPGTKQWLYIGKSDYGYNYTGYIDELRITREAVYEAAFTPPAGEF